MTSYEKETLLLIKKNVDHLLQDLFDKDVDKHKLIDYLLHIQTLLEIINDHS